MDAVLGESPARMLARAGIEATPLRLAVVGAMAGAGRALPAGDMTGFVEAWNELHDAPGAAESGNQQVGRFAYR